MALGNTPRKETSFYVEASKSYAFGIRFQDADHKPLDLTDCQVRLVATESAYPSGVEVLSVLAVSTDPTTGLAQFNLQADDLALDPGAYPYDVTLIPPTGYSTPILKGYIEIGSNTDQDSSNTYTNIQVGSEVTAVLENGDLIEITIERVDGMYLLVTSIISDFAEAMAAEVEKAAGSASDAADSAELAAGYAEEMQAWLDNAGFPFWKGTQAEYDALTPKREVLYLITDAVT